MGFTPKDWTDEADHAGPPASPPGTPFSAAAMEDLETRVTDYAETVAPFFNVLDFGAVPDATTTDLGITWTGTDNTSAFQSAIDALMAAGANDERGGTLYIPKGMYRFSGSINLSNSYGITILGEGGGANIWPPQPSYLVFNTDVGARFIDARSSFGFTLSRVGIAYSHTSFNGTILDLEKEDAYGDTQSAVVDSCVFSGIGDAVYAEPAISLGGALTTTIRNCMFDLLKIAIRGKFNIGEATIYSNAIRIRDNMFYRPYYAIANPGEKWVIDGNCFSGLGAGGNTWCHAALCNVMTSTGERGLGNVNYTGNWHGDAFGDTYWVDGAVTAGSGISGCIIDGNQFSGGVSGVRFGQAADQSNVSIRNNTFSSSGAAINMGGASAIHRMHTITGNSIAGSPPITYPTTPKNMFIQGNTIWNTDQPDQVWIRGHFIAERCGNRPDFTAEAGAGTGASCDWIDGNESDMAGSFYLSTGTSTSSGLMATVTFTNPLPANALHARVLLTPINANASTNTPHFFISQVTATKWELHAGSAPAEGTNYAWNYLVIGA